VDVALRELCSATFGRARALRLSRLSVGFHQLEQLLDRKAVEQFFAPHIAADSKIEPSKLLSDLVADPSVVARDDDALPSSALARGRSTC